MTSLMPPLWLIRPAWPSCGLRGTVVHAAECGVGRIPLADDGGAGHRRARGEVRAGAADAARGHVLGRRTPGSVRRHTAPAARTGAVLFCRGFRARGRLECPSAHHAAQPELAHQPRHGTAGHRLAFSPQLLPHLADAVDCALLAPHASDLAGARAGAADRDLAAGLARS
jgi:hypothetical protein